MALSATSGTLFRNLDYWYIIVVDEEQEIRGIVTSLDVLRWVAEGGRPEGESEG